MKKLFLIITLAFVSQAVNSQIITTGATIQEYVENVLIGGGVEVSNITINIPNGAVDPDTVIGELAIDRQYQYI